MADLRFQSGLLKFQCFPLTGLTCNRFSGEGVSRCKKLHRQIGTVSGVQRHFSSGDCTWHVLHCTTRERQNLDRRKSDRVRWLSGKRPLQNGDEKSTYSECEAFFICGETSLNPNTVRRNDRTRENAHLCLTSSTSKGRKSQSAASVPSRDVD